MRNQHANINAQTRSLRILIAAGGTGGHVYPAIAIADALQQLQANIAIKFVGTKKHMEWQAVPRAGYDIDPIWISGFHRRFTLRNLLFPVKLGASLLQSMRIIASFKPDAMICCGGYVAGPVGWVAAMKKVPLFIQEQNSFPGITNRLLGRFATKIFTAFKQSEQYFPIQKIERYGNPIRPYLTNLNKDEAYEYFNFSVQKSTLLVLGGSGGARSINEAMAKNLSELHDEMNLQIIWQCGENYYDDLSKKIETKNYDRLRLVDFLHHMEWAYAVATVVVSRAGALTCAELALTGNAAILIPSPNVAGDHQTQNAQSMIDAGAAEMITDNAVKKLLPQLVNDLLSAQNKLKAMQQAALKLARPHAAKEIAEKILNTIKA